MKRLTDIMRKIDIAIWEIAQIHDSDIDIKKVILHLENAKSRINTANKLLKGAKYGRKET